MPDGVPVVPASAALSPEDDPAGPASMKILPDDIITFRRA